VDLGRRERAGREHHPPGAGQDPGAGRQADPGTRGISLFIVPKKMVGTEASSPASATTSRWPGLNHKLGWRGTTNTLLNFGEGKYPVRGGQVPAPSATWSASRTRACAACST
jgi:alkylation response protein AidB-like acyl-CoA dehydrogenase